MKHLHPMTLPRRAQDDNWFCIFPFCFITPQWWEEVKAPFKADLWGGNT